MLEKVLSKQTNMKNYTFPKVNFIGNKRKFSDRIVDATPLKHGTVLDLFAGGSSVGFDYKKRGFQVISNDSMYASFVLNKGLIENPNVLLPEQTIEEGLNFPLKTTDRKGLEWLDNNLYYPEEVDELTKLVHYSLTLEGYEKYLFQSLIRRAMIRKLPYSRMNLDWENIKKLRDEEYSYKKYGRRRAYHNESFATHMKKDITSYNEAIFDNNQNNLTVQLDAIEAVKEFGDVDILYLDPPYPGTMNNYSGFYGAFDEIFNKKIEYSDWTKAEKFLNNLQLILDEATKKSVQYLLLSINTRSKPDYKEIISMFNFYGEVEVKERKHNYQVSGKENKNRNKELLIIVKFWR